MSIRALVERHEENFNSGNFDKDRDVFSGDVVIETPGGSMKGIDAHLGFVSSWKAGFPDARLEIFHGAEQGDLFIGEGVFTGTHTADLVGPNGTIPPTGKRIELKFADAYRVKDGRIIEHRVYFDQVAFLTQLGLMPAAH